MSDVILEMITGAMPAGRRANIFTHWGKSSRFVSLLMLAWLTAAGSLAQPINDDHSNPTLFESTGNSVAGTIVGATREPGEDTRFGYSVWWRWIAPSNGVFTFVAESAEFRPLMLIAPSGANLLIGLTNNSVGIMAPERFVTEFPLSATLGTEYTIALFTYVNPRSVGDYALRIVASSPPTATILRPSAYRTRQVVGVPLELEADAHDADGQIVRVDFLAQGKLLSSASSAPYHIFAPTDGMVADRDARLFVVAYDDAGLFGISGWGMETPVTFISLRQPPPSNDSFGLRIPISGETVELSPNNGGAGREPNEPVAAGEQTLWWSWTAPTANGYYVLARGLSACPRVALFTGDEIETLNLVASDGNSGCGLLSSVFLQAEAGRTYALSVGDTCDSLGGSFTLHILPATTPPRIADARIDPAWRDALQLFAVGMNGSEWTVEYSTNLQQWLPCDGDVPFGWADGTSGWADTFLASIGPDGDREPRFYRLRGKGLP